MTKEKSTKSKRRARAVKEDAVDSLLNSLIIVQLKSIVMNLYSKGQLPSMGTRDAVIEAIKNSGRSENDILKYAYKAEIATPYPNCFIAKWSGDLANLNIRKKKLKSTKYPILGEVNLTFSEKGVEETVIVFEHHVYTKEWVLDEEENVKRPVENYLRHPLIVHLYQKQNVIIISYPGFSQGIAVTKEERLDYQQIIEQLLEFLKEEFSITTMTIPFKKIIDDLSDLKSPRLYIVRAQPSNASGSANVKVQRSSEGKSIDDWLTKAILKYDSNLNGQQLHHAIQKFVKDLSHDGFVVFWEEEKVATRINFWNCGAEFLFIWKGVEKSFFFLEEILGILFEYQKNFGDDKSSLLNYIKGLDGNSILKPSDLASRYSQTQDAIKSIISTALKLDLLRPIYRLKTEATIQEIENDWSTNLRSLSKKFTTDSNEIIDGADPKNIEIAFKKVERNEDRC